MKLGMVRSDAYRCATCNPPRWAPVWTPAGADEQTRIDTARNCLTEHHRRMHWTPQVEQRMSPERRALLQAQRRRDLCEALPYNQKDEA